MDADISRRVIARHLEAAELDPKLQQLADLLAQGQSDRKILQAMGVSYNEAHELTHKLRNALGLTSMDNLRKTLRMRHARHLEAAWAQVNTYMDTLKKSLESRGGQINDWTLKNRGNISAFLEFTVEGPNGHKKGEVEFRGETQRPGNIRMKWVRYDGKYYDSPSKLATVILG
jgi:hypothetical protein